MNPFLSELIESNYKARQRRMKEKEYLKELLLKSKTQFLTAQFKKKGFWKSVKVLFPLAALMLAPSPSWTETPEQKGRQIAIEADNRDTGFLDFTADLKMILRNNHGEESQRTIRVRGLEVKGDGDKSISIFDHPKDVKGTAFLSFTHKVGQDDQWLYLPALKRVKRIASNNKSGPFMGSEFAYEDLTSQEVEKYTYKYIKDESYNSMDTFVVERYPVDPKSGYTRQIVWFDKKEYRPQKTEFYDRKNDLLKTLTFSEYNQYKSKFWRAHTMKMVNHQKGKSTVLSWNKYKFGNGLTPRDFDRNSLARAR